jgi:hypothetical protein
MQTLSTSSPYPALLTYELGGAIEFPGAADFELRQAFRNMRFLSPSFSFGLFAEGGTTRRSEYEIHGIHPKIDGSHHFDGIFLTSLGMSRTYKRFLSDWKFQQRVNVSDISNENHVIHKNIYGSVVAESKCGPYVWPEQIWASLPECEKYVSLPDYNALRHFLITDDGKVTMPFVSTQDRYNRTVGYDFVAGFEDAINNTPFQVSTRHDQMRYFYKTHITYTDYGVTIQLSVVDKYRYGLPWHWQLTRHDVLIHVGFSAVSHGLVPPRNVPHYLGNWFDFPMVVSVGHHLPYQCGQSYPSSSDFDAVMAPGFTASLTEQPCFATNLSWALCPDSSVTGMYERFSGVVPETSFYYVSDKPENNAITVHERVVQKIPRLLGANAFSASDAMEKVMPGLENNYIETISEIRSILDPAKIPLEFWKFASSKLLVKRVGKFSSKKFWNGTMELLTLIASTNITYQFGLAPNIRAAQELRASLSDVIDRINSDSMYGYKTYYGSHNWSGLELFPDERFDIRAGTKVVLRVDLDSMLPFLLPLDALGILPTFSRLWETVPWSWFVDYFIPVKSSLRMLETANFALMCDIVFSTNTLKIDRPFTSDEMDANSFYVTKPSGYRTFARYVLAENIPHLGPMEPKLLLNIHLPRWDIVGSLAVLKR